jgi:hypothetical protein
MVNVNFKTFFAVLTGLSTLRDAVSVPLQDSRGFDDKATSIAARATLAAAPHFVIYADKYVSGLTGPPPVTQVQVWRSSVRNFMTFPDSMPTKGVQRLVRFVCLRSSILSISQVFNQCTVVFAYRRRV